MPRGLDLLGSGGKPDGDRGRGPYPKKTFQAAKDSGCGLICAVKGNQPSLLRVAINALLDHAHKADRHETLDKERGWPVARLYVVAPAEAALKRTRSTAKGWRGLIKTFVMVERSGAEPTGPRGGSTPAQKRFQRSRLRASFAGIGMWRTSFA